VGSIPTLGSIQLLLYRNTMKRLVRSKHDRKITGLCAGIAHYIGIDPSLVRLAVLAFTLVTVIFPGLVFYAIGSLIVPEEGEIHA
jgi:phage shock protein C